MQLLVYYKMYLFLCFWNVWDLETVSFMWVKIFLALRHHFTSCLSHLSHSFWWLDPLPSATNSVWSLANFTWRDPWYNPLMSYNEYSLLIDSFQAWMFAWNCELTWRCYVFRCSDEVEGWNLVLEVDVILCGEIPFLL